MKKRDYQSWALSQIISCLSKTPEQEIINIVKTKNGDLIMTINGDTEITIKNKKVKNGTKTDN